jgi:SAM-dependent methyltransferase
VFDVGAGTGYWTAYWLARGTPVVDGCDLVPAAVDRLRESHGRRGTFTVADISAAAALADRQYDLVSCMNVLLHVLDETAFDQAIANIAAIVAPGGHLLLAEPIAVDPAFVTTPRRGDASRVRGVARYAGPLEAAGLRLVRIRPTTVLGANPIEAQPRWLFPAHRAWWGIVGAASRLSLRAGSIVGRFIYAADPLALRTGAAPSGKFALFRRDRPPG